MPSEAQSQVPRDRGPVPPVTRAGRSAQLAKAAATSPAPERRSRGRPRKDGSGVPPTPPPPPPSLTTPPSKSRKKVRSRGRAPGGDEDLMDTTEKNPPKKTEVKEKTTGCRRSTSRRKSNANPEPDTEPSQDHLSPDPDPPHPDPPHPDPPHPDPTLSEASPDPAPSVEEEDRTSLAPAAPPPSSSPGPASGPGEEPRVSSPSPDLDLSLVDSPRPAPDPVEEDCHSPGPMETVTVEAEVGRASRTEPSPCSSPPVSPCPRLEDEVSLSPLFQLLEDSGGSPRPGLGHTKKRLKQCAFCYGGEEPPLGQGRLVVFGPTPGYIPLHVLNRRASSDRDNDCHDHCYRGDLAPSTCSSPEQYDRESSLEFVEQLGPVGLPHDINVQSLFDPTGQCCAHLQCAAWSEGVCRGEGQSLLYVDKAIDSGSTQVCAFCRRLGASLRCQEMSCRQSFHFPCAAAAGVHQDWTHRHTLCTRHSHSVSSQCVLCSSGDVSCLLMCCCCGNCYHGSCLDPPLAPSPMCRAGWQCPQCRVCQSCRVQGDDGALLVCERCDKSYHTHCLTPPPGGTPSPGWRCKNCRICRRCGVRSSGQWANHPFLCELCDLALPCPLCDLDTPQDHVICSCCYRCVHTECIFQAGEGRARSEDYVCTTCRPQEEVPIPPTPIPYSATLSPPLSPTEAPPIITTRNPVQLLSSEPPQSPVPAPSRPTELQQSSAPIYLEPTELQQSPATSPSGPSELQPSPAPSPSGPTEPPQSPAPSPTRPTELEQNPAPSPSKPTALQQSPAPSPSGPTEPPQSPAPSPSGPTEPPQSPAPSPSRPTELQQSPAPSHPEPTELQQSPAPSHPEPTELQQSPAPSHPEPTELQQSPPPSPSRPTELLKIPAPSPSEPTEFQQSPALSPSECTELQQSPAPTPSRPTAHQQSAAPSPSEPTELQKSPAPTPCRPTALQQSPAPSPSRPTALQQSPAPSPSGPTELQQSSAPSPSRPTELQQSPAPSPSEPTELQQSPTPTPSRPTAVQQSPAPSPSEPTELQQSPAPSPSRPTELQQSSAPSPSGPTELQQSPAPSPSGPTELLQSPVSSHFEPTELQQSPAPYPSRPTELQQSPAPSLSRPTELQQSPAPSPSRPTDLQQSPAPSLSRPTELQPSPAPSPSGPTELQQSPAPSPSGPTDLQQSPAPSLSRPTELQQSSAPSPSEPTELQPSPAPSPSGPTELQQSPPPSPSRPTELLKIPAPSPSEPTEFQQSPALSPSECTEFQQSPAPSPSRPTEPPQSPAPSPSGPTELQQSPPPSPSRPTELLKIPAPSPSEPTEFQQSPAPSPSEPTELQQIRTPSHSNQQELQESLLPSYPELAELEESPSQSHLDPTELLDCHNLSQFNQAELQQRPTLNSTEDQLLATNSQSPIQDSPISCSLAHPPCQAGLSPTHVQPGPGEPKRSTPPHSPAQGSLTQTQRGTPCSPTDILITQPQHSPPQRRHSPMPHCHAQVDTSPAQSPTHDAEYTLNQESPRSTSFAGLQCGPSCDISTLDRDLSPVCCRSKQTVRRHASLRPISAPCSPSPSPPKATQCSRSLPASPVQANSTKPFKPLHLSLLPVQLATQSRVTKECTQTSTTELKSLEHSPMQLCPNGQTLESSPTSDLSIMPPVGHGTDGKLPNQYTSVQSSILSSDHSSPYLGPAMPIPESLIYIRTSMEDSSLTLSPCAHDSPSRCTEAIEGRASPIPFQNSLANASPKLPSQTPTSPLSSDQACTSPMPVETTETSSSTQPTSPGTLTASYSAQTISPLTSPVRPSTQPGSPSEVLARSSHPILCQDKEIAVDVNHNGHFNQSKTSPGHPNFSPNSRVNTSPTHACPGSTEANGAYSIMRSTQESTSSLVCSFSELAQTQASRSPKHPDQSSPSHVQTTCSPSASFLSPSPVWTNPMHTSFSPPHCRPTDSSPASSTVCHSSHSAGITDVNNSHSPLRSSPAGQAGPLHIQSTCSNAYSSLVQSRTPSLASTTSSSPAHATVSCVSPPHSPAQASKTYGSPHYSQAPDTGTSSDLTVAQLSPSLTSSSLYVDIVASSIKQSSVLPRGVQLNSGCVVPTDGIRQTSHTPASFLRDDSSAVSSNQVSQSPASHRPIPHRSAGKSQQSPASEGPLYQRPATPVATSPLAGPSHASTVHSSPSQDYTAMPSTSHISETPSQVCPTQASYVHSSPVAPEASPSSEPGSPMRCEAAAGPHSVSPVVATHGQSETSPSPGLTRLVLPDVGPRPEGHFVSSPQQHTTERESSVTVDVSMVEEQEKTTEEKEEMQEKPHQTTKESPEDGGEPDQVEEEDQHCSSDCPPSGVQLGSFLNEDPQSAPPIPPLSTPHSALPLQQPSYFPPSSPPASPLNSPQSPPPPRAGSLEASPHRTALLLSCSPNILPSPVLPLEEEPSYQSKAVMGEAGLEDKPLFCPVSSADDDSQSQSQFELTKDKHQSHSEPLGREEEEPIATDIATSEGVAGQQPMREMQDAEEEEEQGKAASAEQEDQLEVEEEPVSPILELDLDIEVMALMTSSSPPPSLLHLSSPSPPTFSRRGTSRTLRPPCSSRPLDDLSIRLRQSPFSTEASPETSPARSSVTPPPLSPSSTPLQYSPPARESSPLSKAPPITVLPLTPKIGMGKPAISKRKFSPGRARLKQGSWWSNRRVVSPPSSSQDSMGDTVWDSLKPRLPEPPLWSMKVGRGSGFPGRRRSRGGGLGGGRGGRGRSRLKTQDSLTVSPGCVYVEPVQPKEEEENSMHNTVVMFSVSDHFTLRQDMCVVCGSFGRGAEGRLLACSQCGQCYHPYCVNVKVTRVVLTKGWRCLECTVCEACGEASDPGRLLLCDDCDISYHTYCLDPPLQTVPKGAWKCKWCVWCVQCGSASPGLHCDWQNNYSRCGPCASLSRCPLCQRRYTQDDLILQCQQCDRWVHAVCQGLNTEDDVEAAADEGFDCQLCRTHGRSSHGRSEDRFESPYMAQIISRIREPDVKTYTQDGVFLTESGLSHLQSLVEPLTSPRGYRRCKPKLKMKIINQNSVSVLQTPPEPDPPSKQDASRGDLEFEMKSDSSPERDHAHDDVTKESEVTDGNKKRKRKPYRPGIGGFMVRQRGGKAGPSRIKLYRKDSTERLLGDEDVSMEKVLPAETIEKVKKRYRKKKTKLEEAFPSYLQEAFFGRILLDGSRQADRSQRSETPGAIQSGAARGDIKSPAPGLHGPSPSDLPLGAVATHTIKKQGTLPMSEEALLDLSDVLNTDPHILATGHTGHYQMERSLSPFAGLDIGSLADDRTGSGGRGLRAVQEEPLDTILSPELDKMVTDGAILSKLYKIPELEGKDVEEVFTAVLSPNSSNQHTVAGSKTHTAVFPRLPLMNGLMGAAPHFPKMVSGGAQSPACFRVPPAESTAPGSASTNRVSAGESERDVMSTAQRGMLKWEKEETLGEMATVAPVLYCNTTFPQLREQHPDWSTRVKQISKLWRKASSQDRAPFVQMRQKSKQLAKMEASQKLEQVKSEQLLQQKQVQLAGQLSPDAGSQSPAAPRGDTSPLQPPASRQHLLLQSSGLADDVFLRPQAPPPSGFSSLPPSPLPSSPLHQPPSSPQMFSPPSSRPSSPWEPYIKIAGPPRPPSSQAGGSGAPQQQRHNSLSSSPAHDAFGSPAPSPDSKTSDVSRTLGPQQGLQQNRAGMMSPPSGSAPDPSARHIGIRAADSYQRPHNSSTMRAAVSELYGRGGEPVQGGLFKAPMPPQHQLQLEVFGTAGGAGRRDLSRPTDLGFALSQSQDPLFPTSPLSGLGSPHRSPYAQTLGTPRVDYSQPMTDPFTQHSPLTSRPSPDPYTNPQTPGTPHPHSDPTYLTTPPALRLDQYNQQSTSRRPSPSHPNLDPYASNPGTPCPTVTDHFPRSPGVQRNTDTYTQPAGPPRPLLDPYAQQPSTPRPQKAPEPFSQAPMEIFSPQLAGSGSSPLVPGLSGETVTFTPTLHQQSPGRQQQQDLFPSTPNSQTLKDPGISEESVFFAGPTPGHDPFEQSRMTAGPSQMEKTTTNEMAVMTVAPLDGPMSMLPQLGDSEEKLRQRQRLRQLILRQQQQKSVLRQEKGLQEPGPSGPHAAGPALGPATPQHWSKPDPLTAPPLDLFGRPPPPYPGTVRPCGAAGAPAPMFPGGFPGEQQRGFTSRELPVQGPVLRFGVPPGAPAGLQDSFSRPPQGAVSGSGLSMVEGVTFQMKRPVEFTGIRPVPAPGAQLHMMSGVPQPFLPRSLPLQQHSIMGQPYIELRHRAPENRLSLSFSLPETPLLSPRDPQQSPVRPGPEARMGEPALGPPIAMEQLNQQHLGHRESALPEEHLEGEDSAVKDLEDVEVKDLVDLNLNLDPEDGKEDLDLGPNDLHLDDFLLSGKFDLIAYADPELNLEDKKDMFNEELDLGEPVEEKGGGEKRDGASGSRKTDGLISQVKQEVQDGTSASQQPTPHPGVVTTSRPPRPPGPGPGAPMSEAAGSSQNQEQAPSLGMGPRVHPPMTGGQQSAFQQQQRPFGPYPSALFTPHPQSLPVSAPNSLTPQGPPALPQPLSLQPSQPRLLLNPQTQLPHQGSSTQGQGQALLTQDQDQHRPLLLEEQPLLLQELLDQERQEQQQQKQMQALIRQRSTTDPVLPNITDFDSISDPIMKAKMVALKGINKVMTQGNLGLNPMVINRFQQAPVAPVAPVAPCPEGTPQPPHLVVQDGKLKPQLVRPNPPSFGPGFVNESQCRKYEEWLGETQRLLQMQQRLLEDQLAAHRKAKKSLSAKQRTAKKAGRALAEDDAAQFHNITEQQGAVQKQLEQIRKQQKDHAELIEDYRTKQQQQRAAGVPPIPQTHFSQPMVSMQPHLGSPTVVRVPNAPPGWTPGVETPGLMGQRMPLQMPSVLPKALQAPPHTQTLPAVFTGVPAGGTHGAAGDAAAAPPQVKFDDNNPFSEGFQERERREKLREQQERQRVQLMQEVERHRSLQQRLELEQQSLLGATMVPGVGGAAIPLSGPLLGARVGQKPVPGGPAGSALASGSDSPFFSSELPQDFLQSPLAAKPTPRNQGLYQCFTGGPLPPGSNPTPGLLPRATAERGRALPEHGPPMDPHTRSRLSEPTGSSAQEQVRPTGIGATGTSFHPGGQAHRFGHDDSSSSPSTSLPPSFACYSSGGPVSLIQLYSDIIPDDKPKNKRSRKRDGDDTAGGGGARTPLSSHSDDTTAPPTPAVSDTSCSTPTRCSMDQSELFSLNSSLSTLAPSSELERQLSVISAAQLRGSVLGMECPRGSLYAARLEVKQEEREEGGACWGGTVKVEEGHGDGFFPSSSLHGGDGGKELLRHLLKDKMSPAKMPPSPTSQAPPIARRQLSNESVRSEEEDRTGSHVNVVMMDSPDLLDSSGSKKTQRFKRLTQPEKDRTPSKNKRRKKEEEEEKMLNASSTTSCDPLVAHLRQLSVLPLMEPVLGIDLSLFPPHGSSSLGRDSRLTGSFGNGCLDGVTDYYSQLIYKQNNLSNPPTPPASLPPTPPPVTRQKLVNGFATTEELERKEITEHEGVNQKGDGLLALNHATKTVDVPASLPTPPHNNQEELRVHDSSGRDSPDGFVPSSSPDSVADMEVSRYPDLSWIKLELPSPCPSPTIPVMPCAWGKVKQEVKAEPNHQGHPSCSNTDLVTIAITLNPVAAQKIADVMAAVAELLRVPVPSDYQLSRAASPGRSSLALLAGVRVPLTQGSTGSNQQRPTAAAGNAAVRMDYIQHGGASAARSQCCSFCKVLLGNGVRIVKELKQEGQSRSSLLFCSQNCSALYTSDLQSRKADKQAAVPVTLSGSERPPPSRVQHQYTSNMSSIAVHSLLHTPSSPPPTSSPPLSFPPASAITMETRPRMDGLKVKVKLKPRPRAVPGGEDSLLSRHGKRMKSNRWRRWSFSITLSRGSCISNEAVAMPTEEEVDVLLDKLGACLRPDPLPKDQRRCCFCNQQGDGQTDGPARLLNLDLDLWVHLNCALWSSEVYETQAGALINVELALRRSLSLRCAHCQKTGATSGCNRLRCTNTYHFTCALQAHCTFFKDKTMLCQLHKPRTVPLGGDRSSSASPSSTPGPTSDPVPAACDPYDCELRCFAVFRRVFVQRDEARQIAAVVQRSERQHTFRVGSLLFHAIGRLLPKQMKAFHNQAAIFPIGYHTNRIYWSMRHSNRRCKYVCCVEEDQGQPLFKVKVVEKGYDDLILTGPTPKVVWDQILEPVSQMRSSSGTLKLFPVYLKGEDLFGLTTSAVTRIIESLPGVETCERYTFRYGRNPLMEWPLAFNPSGSARSEPKASQTKRPNLLTSIAPRCQGSVGSIVGLVPGVISLSPGESVAAAHQGRHSKSAQYRRMKADWKTNVYLARSRIQGLGLYAARDIEKCTMVIEYIGTIIRSEVANRKERLYESQNRGVYMFRIDNDFVIDATITGGPARTRPLSVIDRYINHSCSPNCITEVVTVEKENKIIISSCRRIQRGEELSYDYKFDLEDDQHKIPCHCGVVNCRKWMN
ncbi:histone-lysine N-methyltransferase 2C-like isoform X10 [Cyclopterus lumpus]|uniref:histone-lysine N-methyltransferase 2C-like isoform X10 n=1 Tax=Cyclopterus lumpus TaxID=8103 RepID=UPI00148739F9|nr:histone-lysine N-methyltransferase 2C-like isoform X10 [Cyclopterus lumpus]